MIKELIYKHFPQAEDLTANNNGWINFNAPYREDKRCSFGINIKNGNWRDMGTDETGTFEELLIKCGKPIDIDLENPLKDKYEDICLAPLEESQLNKLYELGITNKVIEECELCNYKKGSLFTLPIKINNSIYDLRSYFPNQTPKVTSLPGAKSGLIAPFLPWIKRSNEPTIICEGEKDMLVARSLGYNAITLTGGCTQLPNLDKKDLKRWMPKAYIFYDNDKAGKSGSIKLASFLFSLGIEVYTITGHWNEDNDKKDITDLYMEGYRKDYFDKLIESAIKFTERNLFNEKAKSLKEIDFNKFCTNLDLMNRMVKTTIEIVGDYNNNKALPFKFNISKKKDSDGDTIPITLNKNNPLFVEYLEANKFNYSGESDWHNIYQYDIDSPRGQSQYKSYTFKELIIGKVYDVIIYKFSNKNNRDLNFVITDAQEVFSIDEIDEYTLADFKDNVRYIKSIFPKDKEGIINEWHRIITNHIGSYANKFIYFPMLLTYLSPLNLYDINKAYGSREIIKGALDIFIITPPSSSKSDTFKAFNTIFKAGEKIALKNATAVSLVGGMDTYTKKTKLGKIPRENGGLICLEEFQGANVDFISNLTDIRSSGTLTLSRIQREVKAPCLVRFISFANPKNSYDNIDTIKNGIRIVRSLVEKAEDIRRYDLLVVLGSKEFVPPLQEKEDYDFSWAPEYLKYIWTLKPQNYIISKENVNCISKKVLQLQEKYGLCPCGLFDNSVFHKIYRLAASYAALTFNFDSDLSNLIIDEECIDKACKCLNSIYSLKTFNIETIIESEREKSKASKLDIDIMRNIVNGHKELAREIHLSTDTWIKDELFRIHNATTIKDTMLKAKLIQQTSSQGQYVKTMKYDDLYIQLRKE